jgi:hypothetical protein
VARRLLGLHALCICQPCTGSTLHCGTPGDAQDKRRDEQDSSRHPPESGKVVDVDADPAVGGLHHIDA